MAFRLSQCSSVAVPHVSQCDLWVTEVWEQKELEVTYPKSHGCSQPRGGTGSGAAPPKYVLSTSVPWEETEQQPSSACAGPRPSLSTSLGAQGCRAGLPGLGVASAGLLCLLFQAWLAEVEGRLPARGEQRRQSGLYDAQPAPAVNNCAQARERYSIRAALPSGGRSFTPASDSGREPKRRSPRLCDEGLWVSHARPLAPRGTI